MPVEVCVNRGMILHRGEEESVGRGQREATERRQGVRRVMTSVYVQGARPLHIQA